MLMNKKNILSQAQEGFSLLEVMVVLVILGLLMGIVAPNLLGNVEDARIKTAKLDMSNVEKALSLYKLDNAFYPTSEQGVEALVTKPAGTPEPKNYKKDGYMPNVPTDPWDNEYQYIAPGENGPFDLYSLGPDGTESEDDIYLHEQSNE